jgi:hypothetical protein
VRNLSVNAAVGQGSMACNGRDRPPGHVVFSGPSSNKSQALIHAASGTETSGAMLRNSDGELICAEAQWYEDLPDMLS